MAGINHFNLGKVVQEAWIWRDWDRGVELFELVPLVDVPVAVHDLDSLKVSIFVPVL